MNSQKYSDDLINNELIDRGAKPSPLACNEVVKGHEVTSSRDKNSHVIWNLVTHIHLPTFN